MEIAGKRVSASQHPAGIIFCKDLFAKKIVVSIVTIHHICYACHELSTTCNTNMNLLGIFIQKQGDEQVSSSHDSAFAIATVTVGVWCEFADVGSLLMAHFYEKCPYLVPYYIPKKDGQSREDFYK